MEPAQENTPGLIDALSFKQSANSAKYITSSRQASFYAPGDRFSGATSRVIRINISGSGYLDMSSLVLAATATNETPAPVPVAATPLVPLTQTTANLFSRLTVSVGGAICEDISQYNRLSELLSMFESASKRANNRVLGWGGAAAPPATASIERGDSKEILHVPLSGLAGSGKWIPLDFCQGGLTYVFELAAVGEAWNTTAPNGSNCVLSNVRMLGTVVQIDSELHSAYASYILNESGRLQIPCRTWTSQIAALPQSPNWSVTVSRSFKRLNTILLTMYRAVDETGKLTNTFTAPGTPDACEGWVQSGQSAGPTPLSAVLPNSLCDYAVPSARYRAVCTRSTSARRSMARPDTVWHSMWSDAHRPRIPGST